MRVLVVGCGSIGARRARLLAEMGHEVYVADADGDRAFNLARTIRPTGHAARLPIALTWHSDAAFICTPPETHVPLALECLRAGVRGVFIEKPLSTRMEGIDALRDAAQDRTVMVACNMRWAYGGNRAGLAGNGVRSLRAVVSKPLETWREGAVEAYRRNGVVLEAAVHELDLAIWLAGPVAQVGAVGNRDTASIWLEHESGATSMVHASWDMIDPGMRYLSVAADGGVRWHEPDTSDAMYRAEMQHFLDCVETDARPCNTIDVAAHVLAVALEARDACARS